MVISVNFYKASAEEPFTGSEIGLEATQENAGKALLDTFKIVLSVFSQEELKDLTDTVRIPELNYNMSLNAAVSMAKKAQPEPE